MLQWQRWSPRQRDRSSILRKIDRKMKTQIKDEIDPKMKINLGKGQTIHAIDVVEGHAQRLRKAKTNAAPAGSEQAITSAVRTVAPEVAPLTDLALNIANNSTNAQPASKFRKELQQALETSHRQQSVRRSLGIQAPAKKDPPWWQSSWFLFVVATLLIIVTVGIASRNAKKRNER